VNWKEGVEKMVKEYEDEKDDIAASVVAGSRLEANEDKSSEKSPPPQDDVPFIPPPPDPMLQIPGDRLLAREKNGSSIYWPALLEEYIPPQRPKQKAKYRVRFLDNTKSVIPRDWFYTSEEPEFSTCKACICLSLTALKLMYLHCRSFADGTMEKRPQGGFRV